ncbi:MAG: GNAT family N-acetyltransferase [Actinomycetaceae bacterium]|nr:GNAT family N-acetyltransferase [Actinomycetaceae bacterium]
MGAITYRFATRADRGEAEDLFAESFATASYFEWMHPEGNGRADALVVAFAPEIAHNLASPGCLLPVAEDGERLVAGALWQGPDRWQVPAWRSLAFLPRQMRLGDRRRRREFFERGEAFEHALAEAHPREPHWYLALFGCRPDYRGRRLAAPLMRAGLDRAAHDCLPAYLECERALIGLYESYGFEVIKEIAVPPGSPAMFGMWREA